MLKTIIKYLFYGTEFILYLMLATVFFVLPFRWSSQISGWLFRSIGVYLPVNQVAYKNLAHVYPNQSKVFYDNIIHNMWDNFGRVHGEYYKLSFEDVVNKPDQYQIIGQEFVQHLIDDQQPGFILTTHQGNWELGTLVATRLGLKTVQVTRFLNNPLMRTLINFIHGRIAQEVIPKGYDGARRIIAALKEGRPVSMMMDQKLNEGIDVPFFGKTAKTATAMVKLAQKFECPILPVQVIRCNDTQFKIIFHQAFYVKSDVQNSTKNLELCLYNINQMIEKWIREVPEQWFWVHRRFPKSFYKAHK